MTLGGRSTKSKCRTHFSTRKILSSKTNIRSRSNPMRNKTKQECIPVGCVPPASVAISGGWCLPFGRGGGSAHPPWMQTPPRGKTNTCENITFPQTSFAGCKYLHFSLYCADKPSGTVQQYSVVPTKLSVL